MNRCIGFLSNHDGGQLCPPESPAPKTAPVRSLVSVRFPSYCMPLTYYNDRFDLHEGDVVFVSGKLAGTPGTVAGVSTKFRIHTNDYEKVLSVLDLHVHGVFHRVGPRMVCSDLSALPPAQFESWVFPPKAADAPAEEDDLVCGEGYCLDLSEPEACEDLRPVILERAVCYCEEGRVRYLSLQDGAGRAYVEGRRWYRVDFRYTPDGQMTDLFCDCPCPFLCKHEAAAALTLRALLQDARLTSGKAFFSLDEQSFRALAAYAETITL